MAIVEEMGVNKYNRPYAKAFAHLPEPEGMFRRFADEKEGKESPLHPLLNSLFRHGGSGPIEHIIEGAQQDPDISRKDIDFLVEIGLLKLNSEQNTVSYHYLNQ